MAGASQSQPSFAAEKKLVTVMRKDLNRGPQNWPKYILHQKNVEAGKNLPYGSVEVLASP